MLYVFLDIGGVLNRKDSVYDEESVNFSNMRYFGQALHDFSDVRIVLISQLRDYFRKEEACEYPFSILQSTMERWGPQIYDVIPKKKVENRYQSIKEYIQEHDVEHYVIIDDEYRYYPKECECLYHVDGKEGFTKTDMARLFPFCVRVLYGPLKPVCIREEKIEIPSDEEYLRMKRAWEPDYIKCILRVKEAYKETGQYFTEEFNAKAVFLDGLMSKSPSYDGDQLDGTNLTVYSDEVLGFIKALEEYVRGSFPISNILDMFWFDTSDEQSRKMFAEAQEKYLGEKGI